MTGPNGIEGSQRPDASVAMAPVRTESGVDGEQLVDYLLQGYERALINLNGSKAVIGVPDRIRHTNPRHANYLHGLHGIVNAYEDISRRFGFEERAYEIRTRVLGEPTEEHPFGTLVR